MFNERLELLRKVGAGAAKDFPAKYRDLGEWFKKYDQLNLLVKQECGTKLEVL